MKLNLWKYRIREYKYDLITAGFAIALAVCVYLYSRDQRILFVVSISIILLSLICIVYIRNRDKDFYFIPLSERKHKNNWIGLGTFDYSKTYNCFKITKAHDGFFYSKCLTWSDYKYEFEFKLLNTCLGVIVRAVNLANYVMLQIAEPGINPHIKINGGWKRWEHDESNLSFENKLSFDKWYKCSIVCEGQSIAIKIWDQKSPVCDRNWNIPPGPFYFVFGDVITKDTFAKNDKASQIFDSLQAVGCIDKRGVVIVGFEKKRKDFIEKCPLSEEEVEEIFGVLSQVKHFPFPVSLDYGSVGVRDSGGEASVIRNVLIEKI